MFEEYVYYYKSFPCSVLIRILKHVIWYAHLHWYVVGRVLVTYIGWYNIVVYTFCVYFIKYDAFTRCHG